MGDSGTLTFTGTGGSSVLNAIDDVTPTANEESDDVTGADTKFLVEQVEQICSIILTEA